MLVKAFATPLEILLQNKLALGPLAFGLLAAIKLNFSYITRCPCSMRLFFCLYWWGRGRPGTLRTKLCFMASLQSVGFSR